MTTAELLGLPTQLHVLRAEVQQVENDIIGYEMYIAKLDTDDAPMERQLQVLDHPEMRTA